MTVNDDTRSTYPPFVVLRDVLRKKYQSHTHTVLGAVRLGGCRDWRFLDPSHAAGNAVGCLGDCSGERQKSRNRWRFFPRKLTFGTWKSPGCLRENHLNHPNHLYMTLGSILLVFRGVHFPLKICWLGPKNYLPFFSGFKSSSIQASNFWDSTCEFSTV